MLKEIFGLHKIFFLNESILIIDNTLLDPNQYHYIS
jgi:hypothetical protein